MNEKQRWSDHDAAIRRLQFENHVLRGLLLANFAFVCVVMWGAWSWCSRLEADVQQRAFDKSAFESRIVYTILNGDEVGVVRKKGE